MISCITWLTRLNLSNILSRIICKVFPEISLQIPITRCNSSKTKRFLSTAPYICLNMKKGYSKKGLFITLSFAWLRETEFNINLRCIYTQKAIRKCHLHVLLIIFHRLLLLFNFPLFYTTTVL